jgi:hypothetical protein
MNRMADEAESSPEQLVERVSRLLKQRAAIAAEHTRVQAEIDELVLRIGQMTRNARPNS